MTGTDVAQQLHAHIASLRRYALVLTRDRHDAEDLVQECLVRAIAAADSWRPGSDLRVWLFRILHNVHVSEMRKRKVRRDARMELPEPVVEDDPHARLELRRALDALEALPEAQRRPIVLVALREMSYAEAAETLDLPLGTFMSRLGRGRAKMRRILEGMKAPTQLRLVA